MFNGHQLSSLFSIKHNGWILSLHASKFHVWLKKSHRKKNSPLNNNDHHQPSESKIECHSSFSIRYMINAPHDFASFSRQTIIRLDWPACSKSQQFSGSRPNILDSRYFDCLLLIHVWTTFSGHNIFIARCQAVTHFMPFNTSASTET